MKPRVASMGSRTKTLPFFQALQVVATPPPKARRWPREIAQLLSEKLLIARSASVTGEASFLVKVFARRERSAGRSTGLPDDRDQQRQRLFPVNPTACVKRAFLRNSGGASAV